MTTFFVLLATLVAGGVATVIRFVVVSKAPIVGVHAVNIVGTVVLAFMVALLNAGRIDWPVALVFGVGFSGALTTFSTWIVLIDARLSEKPLRTVVADVLAPVLLAVALSVLVFVTVS